MALGRGLDVLFGEITQSYENDLSNDEEKVVEIKVEDIRPNPYQPRKSFDEDSLQELSDSILSHGLLQPVIIVKDETGFMLIAGERRLRASKLAKLKTIKAIIADIDIGKIRQMALIENIQREDLNPIDLAYSYQELLDEHNITHEELSDLIFKSRTQITNTLRLLNLEDFVQQALVETKITQGHARALIGLDAKEQRILLDTVIGQKLSVREVEEIVKRFKNSNQTSITAEKEKKVKYDFSPLGELLDNFGISYKLGGTSIKFDFNSQEEIEKFKKLLENL